MCSSILLDKVKWFWTFLRCLKWLFGMAISPPSGGVWQWTRYPGTPADHELFIPDIFVVSRCYKLSKLVSEVLVFISRPSGSVSRRTRQGSQTCFSIVRTDDLCSDSKMIFENPYRKLQSGVWGGSPSAAGGGEAAQSALAGVQGAKPPGNFWGFWTL